jgi:hypothetical protein
MVLVTRGKRRGVRLGAWAGALLCLPLAAGSTPQQVASEKVYGVQLHVHGSTSEGSGSMHGHNVEAKRLGDAVDVLWWSDHDWRLSAHTYVTDFHFEHGLGEAEFAPAPLDSRYWESGEALPAWAKQAAVGPDAPQESVETVKKGWARLPVANPAKSVILEVSDDEARQGCCSLRVTLSGTRNEWERVALAFETSWRRHIASLASGVRVRLSLMPVEMRGDARIVVSALLSQHPPDYRGRLDYRLSRAGIGADGPSVAVSYTSSPESSYPIKVATIELPHEAGRWNDLIFDLTTDAKRHGLGGIDNSLNEFLLGFEVRRNGHLVAHVDALEIERQQVGEPLFQAEKQLAQALSREGIVNHVGQEISYAAHLNAFGPNVPLADSVGHPHGYIPSEAVEFAHSHGGIVSLNHFFSREITATDHNLSGTRQDFDRRVERLVELRAYGADLLEVGYRARGHGLPAYLELWDRLSAAGIFITGVGVSDSHDNDVGWLEGPNNFITWVYAASHAQEDLIEALRAGRAFFGDPTRFDGRLDITTSGGGRMGQVLSLGDAGTTLTYSADGLRPGQRIRIVRDGRIGERLAPSDRSFEFSEQIAGGEPTFVRFEVVDDQGPVALSNPVYLLPEPLPRGVPSARR